MPCVCKDAISPLDNVKYRFFRGNDFLFLIFVFGDMDEEILIYKHIFRFATDVV